MTTLTRDILSALPGFQAPEAGVFFAQLEDQSRRLTEDTLGLTVDELAWQPQPGMNTIGMLLAHIAVVEVYWTANVTRTECRCREVLGIEDSDDGMPLPAGGEPPAGLKGKGLSYFDDLLARARHNTREKLGPLRPEELDDTVEVKPRDGVLYRMNRRWILYHMVEHEAGHYGQVNLLRHLYRTNRGGS